MLEHFHLKEMTMTRTTWLALALGALMLTGCGGGGGTAVDNTPSNKVPASALISPLSYTQFVGSLKITESGEGLSMEGLTPPVSDTEEPQKLS